ncbi:MAG TPA: S8 family peptidase, partial [Pyrinomonadaceae bacterium]|nr:S8 family peptidase [Pyrinomonadaceae bacterium]
ALSLYVVGFGPKGVSAESNISTTPGTAKRSQSEKISETLRKNTDEIVQIILQLNATPTGRLNALLQRNGVRVKEEFEEFQSAVVELPSSVLTQLAEFDEVEFISLDREVRLLGHVEKTTGAAYMRTQSGNSGFKGKDVNIAVLDSGIDKDHHQIGSRIETQLDFTGEGRLDDVYGHGTHVAALAAGLDHVAHGAYTGVAPEARVINLRVLNSQGLGAVSNVLKGLNWILAPVDPTKPLGEKNYQKYRIKVVNLSLGTPAVDSYKDDPLCIAARRLVNSGIVVVAAAGNNGTDATGRKIYGRIHSPGNEPAVITVGAANTFGTDIRTDDGVTTYSSRGPTRSYRTVNGVRYYDHIIKPDLIAPGNKLISAESRGNRLISDYPQLECTPTSGSNHKMMRMSGTSMATPLVSGAASLLLQANPKLTPNLVKMILMYTAQPLAGYNMLEQGAGQLNIEGAMRLARLVRTDLSNLTPLGAPLLITSTPPNAFTSLDGYTFRWAQGILLNRGYATGVNLITRYHRIYDLGVATGDGVAIGDG